MAVPPFKTRRGPRNGCSPTSVSIRSRRRTFSRVSGGNPVVAARRSRYSRLYLKGGALPGPLRGHDEIPAREQSPARSPARQIGRRRGPLPCQAVEELRRHEQTRRLAFEESPDRGEEPPLAEPLEVAADPVQVHGRNPLEALEGLLKAAGVSGSRQAVYQRPLGARNPDLDAQ